MATRETSTGTSMRILVIEDEPDHCDLIEQCLRAGDPAIEVTVAGTVEAACRLLDEQRFDCVTLDHTLPDGAGTEVLDRMEEKLLTTPVIGLSTSRDAEVALADFRAGAIEFLQKQDALTGSELYDRIRDAITRHRRRMLAAIVQQRREESGIDTAHEKVLAAARMDALTGIFNRGAFDEIHAEIHRRRREERGTYTLCLTDVDNFKKYNDQYGHAAGDDVLRAVATALHSTLREVDFVGRYGGEEFVVLLDGVGEDSVAAVVRRLVRLVAGLGIRHDDNAGHGQVTMSVGAAVFDPLRPESCEEILKRADRALYAAKDGGRNRAVIAEPQRKAA